MSLPTTAEGCAGHVSVPALWQALKRWNGRRALEAARFAADSELEYPVTPPLALSWRVEELVAPKRRLDLAHALRSLVRDAGGRYLPDPERVNRNAVRDELERFLELAERLASVERPVAARGVVLTERLLDDTAGPLYDRDRARELPAHLDRALDALEPR